MENRDGTKAQKPRRVFRWPAAAEQLGREYKERIRKTPDSSGTARASLVTRLVQISGNPRDACLRFLRKFGITGKRDYHEWTRPEQQRLLDLITTVPVTEAAKMLRRSPGSVRSMLHRLGMGGTTGREWFTKHSLSRALHTRPDEVQKWIDRGWLKSRPINADGLHVQVIDPDDFCVFVKQHGREAVGRRLTYEALWFVQNYVFPPSHASLLSVRGSYDKRTDAAESASLTTGLKSRDSEADDESDAPDNSA